jgi:hypothetical protein
MLCVWHRRQNPESVEVVSIARSRRFCGSETRATCETPPPLPTLWTLWQLAQVIVPTARSAIVEAVTDSGDTTANT